MTTGTKRRRVAEGGRGSKAASKPHDVRDTGGPIVRGSVPFIKVTETGELGDNGKVVMSVGYSGRIIGKAKYPLASLAIPVIDMLLQFVCWRGDADPQEDLDLLKEYIGRLHATKPKERGGK